MTIAVLLAQTLAAAAVQGFGAGASKARMVQPTDPGDS